MSTPALLAFGFVNPFLLWGLLLAGVPLLIQWLHRRKYTERVWAAMRFLRAATESQTRRLRMESLLLLCVRTLILLLAAVALAEPFLAASGWLGGSEAAKHTLILLDTSLSMHTSVEGVPLSERAKDAAKDIVRAGKPGDSYQLLTIATPPDAIIAQLSFSFDDVLAEIDRIVTSETFGDVPEAAVKAQTVLASAAASGPRKVVIISDFQRTNWRLEEPAAQERTRKALTGLSQQATVSLVLVGMPDVANAAVLDARAESTLTSLGTPASITAQVQNFSPKPRRQQRLQLLEEGRVLQSQSVDLPPYAEVTALFDTQWNEPGRHALQIRLEDDPLPPDNDRWLVLDVKEELSVLLVNGRVADRALEGATDFVELALRPAMTSEAGAGVLRGGSWAIKPKVISEAELLHTDLSEFDCVFVCDVPFLGDDEVARLETFVRAGGGLVIGMGEQVQLDAYSRQLSAQGTGLVPVQLVRVVGDDEAAGEPFHFAEPVGGHSVTRPFAGNPRSGLTTANIYRYVEARLPEDSSARTAIAFAHGGPAVIEHNFGAGRVLLVTTSLDDRWGSWALWPSFLPMMHRLLEYAVSGATAGQTLVGQPLHVELPQQDVLGQSVDWRRPDGRSSSLPVSHSGQAADVTFDATSQSGIYCMTLGPPTDETKLFAVNVDTRESDLRVLGEPDWQDSVLGSIPFELAGAGGLSPTLSEPDATGSRLAGWLLLAILVLLLVEQLMAWNGRLGYVALLASPLVVVGLRLLPATSLIVLAGVMLVLTYRRHKGWFSRG